MFCSNCGTKIPDDSTFCINCGMPVGDTPPVQGGALAPTSGLLGAVFARVFGLLLKKPLRLWGLSLLGTLLTVLATVFGVLPIISIPLSLVLTAGMSCVYLDGLRGENIDSEQIFAGFKDFWRVAGGMCWRALWMFIWAAAAVGGLVLGFVSAGSAAVASLAMPYLSYGYGRHSSPILSMLLTIVGAALFVVGLICLVIFIIKTYSYRFVPYILLKEKDVSALQALKKSMAMTKGYRGQMFLADFLSGLAIVVTYLMLVLLGKIPYVGGLFTFALILAQIVVQLFSYIYFGLLQATFYDEVASGTANYYAAPAMVYNPPVVNAPQAATEEAEAESSVAEGPVADPAAETAETEDTQKAAEAEDVQKDENAEETESAEEPIPPKKGKSKPSEKE